MPGLIGAVGAFGVLLGVFRFGTVEGLVFRVFLTVARVSPANIITLTWWPIGPNGPL